MFRQYMHLVKFGMTEVEGIEFGKVYIFPKIDGTNASTWLCEPLSIIEAGSRTRGLSEESDNAGFYSWVVQQQHLKQFHAAYPKLRLYGEWLVPHTFKGYREDAWRKFYVFDVYNDETQTYLSYDQYQPILEQFGVDYIPPLAIIKNASYDNFLKYLNENKYLCPDNGEPGEGIVIKNYDYYNRFERQVWAKIVRQEFKEQHYKTMGAPEINSSMMNEERIVDTTVTLALIDKTMAKIVNGRQMQGQLGTVWNSKMIPELLNRVFYDVVTEEFWDAWKDIDFGTVNGKTLRALVTQKIKTLKPEIFVKDIKHDSN